MGEELTVPNHPLAEVFGYPTHNFSAEAVRHRQKRLCPFNNKVPSCTKDKAEDPLGVCSVYDGNDMAITCPIRFRQDWIIADAGADFFFPQHTRWTSLTEIRLNDKHDKSAGNIDVVLVAYDDHGRIIDFGALEVQAVYITGNIRAPFQHYMEEPERRYHMDWSGRRNYPHPDYLSSSRKRLAPQMLYKGAILNGWGKKMAVAVHSGFYSTLPRLPECEPAKADIAWLIHDLIYSAERQRFDLVRRTTVYTSFKLALDKITIAEPGPISDFIEQLQERLSRVRRDDGDASPDAPALDEILQS